MTKEDQILEILHEHTKLLNTCIHTLDEHTKTLDEHTRILDEHTKTLNEHTQILNEHSKKIAELSEKVNQLSEMVTEHTYILLDHSERIDKLAKKLCALEEKVDSMHQTLILLEVDFSDKSTVLFDGHTIHQEHLKRNEKDIQDLQKTTHSHSSRLISLEINSREYKKQLEHLSSSK